MSIRSAGYREIPRHSAASYEAFWAASAVRDSHVPTCVSRADLEVVESTMRATCVKVEIHQDLPDVGALLLALPPYRSTGRATAS